jgi:tRNA(Arg) A34 adenosine deaminase TadA
MKKYFQLAKKTATAARDRRKYRLGAVGVRRDGAIVTSSNLPTQAPEPEAHAEARVVKKLDKGSVVYVVRVTKKDTFTMARPCKNCLNAMRFRGVKKCYYTITESEYGVILF